MRYFSFAGGRLPLGEKTYIMGILNVTPDSFYDGGRYFDPAAAVEKALSLVEEGADILDLGAVSTRPGGERAEEATELMRLKNVLPAIRKKTDVTISVDTYRPAVARFCLENGVNIINDVSGVFNPAMAAVVRDYGAGWVVMHAGMPGARTETVFSYPGGVVNHVRSFFIETAKAAAAFGIPAENLCFDPGFGFAKTEAQNLELLGLLPLLKNNAPLLVGLSRKRFARLLAKGDGDEDALLATLLLDRTAAECGADILRVHDVKAHKAMLNKS